MPKLTGCPLPLRFQNYGKFYLPTVPSDDSLALKKYAAPDNMKEVGNDDFEIQLEFAIVIISSFRTLTSERVCEVHRRRPEL